MSSGRLDAFVPPPPPLAGPMCSPSWPPPWSRCPPAAAWSALDGVDGAGKTVLARELAALVAPHREVHRASVDGFHRPARSDTPAAGPRRPSTETSTTTPRCGERLVGPFRAGEPWVRAVHDVEREVVLDLEPEPGAGRDAVLVVDGIFLHRPELADLWDLDVWLEVPFEVSVPRGNARFGAVGAAGGRPGIRGERPLRRRAAALPRRGRPGRPGDLGARQHRPRGAGAHG